MTFKAIIEALLVALLIIALNVTMLEAVARVWAINGGVSDSHSVEFDVKYQLAREKPRAQHLIFLMGNSRMRRTFSGEVIEKLLKESGLSVEIRNLACSSCTPGMNLFLLQTALNSNVKPDYVFFNTDPRNYFSADPNMEGALQAEKSFHSSYLGQCLASNEKNGIPCLLKRYSYLVRYRDFYKGELGRLPQLLFKSDRKRLNQQQETWRHYETRSGWAPLHTFWTDKEFDNYTAKLEHDRHERYGPLKPFVWSEAMMTDFQTYTHMHNIPLVWVHVPKFSSPVAGSPGDAEGEEILARLKDYAKTHNQKLLDFSHSLKTDSKKYFHDAGHVNLLGALKLSEEMASILAVPPFDTLRKRPEGKEYTL